MLVGILSKTWWTSLVKSDDRAPERRDPGEDQPEPAQADELEPQATAETQTEAAPAREESPRERERGPRRGRNQDSRQEGRRGGRRRREEEPVDDEDEEIEVHAGSDDATADDPLAMPYDEFEQDSEPRRGRSRRGGDSREGGQPWRAKVQSAKEFFTTEVLYRYDLLEREERSRLATTYRIELKGNKGGVWTLTAQDELEIVNRREEAELVLTMQHRDFLALVNGDLNPQLAMLAQKIRVQGDYRKAVHGLSLFAPASE